MNRVAVERDMFSWARERSRLDAVALTARFPHLEAWENGEAQPTLKQLEHYAKATYTPIGYFFLTEPPAEPLPIPDFRTMGNRVVQRPSPNLLDTVYACQRRQDWYLDDARVTGQS